MASIICTIDLSESERQIIVKAFAHVGIAYPHREGTDPESGLREFRSFKVLALGRGPYQISHVERACRAVDYMYEIVSQQTSRQYWLDCLNDGQEPPKPTQLGGLATQNTDAITLIMESRSLQLSHIVEAKKLLDDALWRLKAAQKKHDD